MRDNLFIRINGDSNDVDWIVSNKSRSKSPRHGALSDLKKISTNKRVILIVNGCDVLLCKTTIPTRNKQRLQKAIPFALEEYLINDIDNQFFALANTNSANQQEVAVIERSTLDALMNLLGEHNIRAELAIPEMLLLPLSVQKIAAAQDTWLITTTGDKSIVRTGRYSGFCIDNNNIETLLENYSPTSDKDNDKILKQIIYIQTRSAPKSNNSQDNPWQLAVKHDTNILVREFPAELLTLYARSFSEANSINLLQANNKKQERRNIQWKQWKVAAIAAATLLCVQAIFIGFKYKDMSNEYSQLKKESRKLFKQAFPNARRFVKMRLRMKNALARSGNSSGVSRASFIELLGLTGNTIKDIKSLQLATINFRRGELNVHFTVDQANKIDILEQGLKRSGLKVSRGASSKTRKGYTGVLRIIGKGNP